MVHTMAQSVHHSGCGIYTFSRGVAEERPLRGGKRALSPQNIPLLLGEMGPEQPTIPLQKAPLSKECRNVATPHQVTSNPP